MKITISKFMAISLLTLGVSACMEGNSVLSNPPGTYEKSSSSTNPNGTDVKRDSTAQVRYDANGNKEAVVETKTTTDPKGLFNKQTTVQKEKVTQY